MMERPAGESSCPPPSRLGRYQTVAISSDGAPCSQVGRYFTYPTAVFSITTFWLFFSFFQVTFWRKEVTRSTLPSPPCSPIAWSIRKAPDLAADFTWQFTTRPANRPDASTPGRRRRWPRLKTCSRTICRYLKKVLKNWIPSSLLDAITIFFKFFAQAVWPSPCRESWLDTGPPTERTDDCPGPV